MLPTLEPARLIEVIDRRVQENGRPIQAFWYSLSGPREEFARCIAATQRATPIVPLIPRRPGMFEAPNALVSDIVQLIDEGRQSFLSMFDADGSADSPIAILILSRSPLAVPGGCSPTPIPSWFPRIGGTIIDLQVDDLTFSADAPLNCSEAKISALCEALFALENALVLRLKTSFARDAASSRGFFSAIGSQQTAPSVLLDTWERNAQSVMEPSGFRPSVKDGSSIIARLVGLFVKTTPDQLSSLGDAVGKAFSCDSETNASIVSVLFRPTQRRSSTHAAFGRNLLLTVYAAYQYVTAAAHADAYPRYPVFLIHGLARHLVDQIQLLSAELSVESRDGSPVQHRQ
jgi:hypothetical protein